MPSPRDSTWAELAAPTPKAEIKQRKGPGGKQLDYVDARYVMERLDSVVGPENWQDRYEPATIEGSIRAGIGIRVGVEWIWKWDVGDPSDIEPTKGAHSDAFKRAAVKWGVARDLYGDHASPNGLASKGVSRPTGGQEAREDSPAPRDVRPVAAPAPPSAGAAPETPFLSDEEVDSLFATDQPDKERSGPPAKPGSNAPPMEKMRAGQLFDRAEKSGTVDKKALSAAAKRLFGDARWKITELSEEEIAQVAAEVGLA